MEKIVWKIKEYEQTSTGKMELENKMKLLIQLLKDKGIRFEKGLTDEELITIEADFNFRFPPDLQVLLCLALPVSKSFVDWRRAISSRKYETEVLERIHWPLEGMLFDIRNNVFWNEEWGEKPELFEQQKEIAEEHFQKYPRLIPIYSHRYIPVTPYTTGNPVFSVYQMDIIYYGNGLASYFRNEFHVKLPDYFNIPNEAKHIEFWSKQAEW